MTENKKNNEFEKMSAHALISRKAAENTEIMNKNTAIAYNRIWRDFSEYLDNTGLYDIDDLTKSNILHFLSKLNMKPFAYNQARSAIIKILSDIEDDYSIKITKLENIKRQVKPQKVKSDDRLFLSKKELNEARESAVILFPKLDVQKRNIFIYDLMVHTMMRVDEVALIQLADINLENGMLGVRGKGASGDTKGNRVVNAHIKLSPKLISQAVEYVRSWRYRADTDQGKPYLDHPLTIYSGMPLFTSQYGKALDVSTIKKRIGSMIAQVFIENGKPVPRNHGPHCIRRSVATLKYKKSKDIIMVQRLLRHASHITTMKYIGVDQDAINDAYMMKL